MRPHTQHRVDGFPGRAAELGVPLARAGGRGDGSDGATPRFRFEELCGTPAAPQDPREYAVAARAVVANPEGQWQLQAQVLHWRGDTWLGGQLASSVFNAAVAALRTCQDGAPSQSPSITTAQANRMAAVISGPVIMHTYLVAHPQSSTISGLTLWSTAPPEVQWPATPDATVLEAMTAPLCAAYISSCQQRQLLEDRRKPAIPHRQQIVESNSSSG